MSAKNAGIAKTTMELVRGFQPACVVIAGAELDIFTLLKAKPRTAAQVARKIGGDLRATIILLDALAAMKMLSKTDGARPSYGVPESVAPILAEGGGASMVGMVRHLGNCLRNWSQLAQVVLQGKPANRRPSVRGAEGDLASFIQAMHEVSAPLAAPLVHSLGPLKFSHLLDVAGASGTWTVPFLRMNPGARATIFDLPEVVPMAKRLMKKIGLSGKVRLVGGDYHTDALPTGADLAWVSAIVHQNSDEENRRLFRKVFAALQPGGQILIRDIVMDAARTRPAAGALFAVNMLVGTPRGGTYTFGELRDALTEAGFRKVRTLRRGAAMDSVLCATKP
jgi:precorrin-6B methylase 2